MKCKITSYRKYFCLGWFCLLMLAVNSNGACKIEDLLHAERKVGAKSLADGYRWGKQGVGPRIARSDGQS